MIEKNSAVTRVTARGTLAWEAQEHEIALRDAKRKARGIPQFRLPRLLGF